MINYGGKNGSAVSYFTAFAVPTEGQSSFSKFMLGARRIETQVRLPAATGDAYRFEERTGYLHAKRENCGMMIALGVALLLFGAGMLFRRPWIGIAALTLYGLAYSVRSYVLQKMGDITMTTEADGDNALNIKLTFPETGASFRTITTDMRVYEQVLDTRGTSAETRTATLYEFPTDRRLESGTTYWYKYRFPAGLPPSFDQGNVQVVWEFKVEVVTSLGMRFFFTPEVAVGKY